MRLTLLGSGSSGNVAFVEAGPEGARTRLLVDAGLPPKEIDARLERVPGPRVTVETIDGVLLTHEHADHGGHAAALARLGRPLYATAGTRRALGVDATLARSGEPVTIGALEVTPVLLPHDAEETVGYRLSDGETSIGILTDCGHDAPEVARAFAGCRVLVLEANHDEDLLAHGPYPFSLKRRVGGRRGHLSNEQAASLLRQICALAEPPRLVIAAHLSQVNNRPELARRALARVLQKAGRVIVANQAEGSPLVEIASGVVRLEPGRREQLAFDFPSAEPARLPAARAREPGGPAT